MALPAHSDGQAKIVATIGGFGVMNSERPAAEAGTEYVGYVTPKGEWLVMRNVRQEQPFCHYLC
jgi:hypothetical protein